ncbi:hypothetical protein IID22_03860 [Patescibacteria group bacterium]|nr:hypothetical protein [Patescibacteria group bacterium]
MTKLEFAKRHLSLTMKYGQADYDLDSMTGKEITEESSDLESRADAAYDQWKERYNE